MARSRSPNRDKAFEIYKKHKGKIKNKEIAEMLGEDPKTISKWKTLDKWEENIKKSKNKSENSKFEKGFERYSIEDGNMEVEDEIKDMIENDELTDKQTLFCIYYIQYFNATKAYQKAYGCNKVTAKVNGSKLLSKTNIRNTISSLKQNRLNRALIDADDIFQRYMDIAFADITDYITFGKKDTLIGVSNDGTAIYAQHNYVDYHESEDIDGSLITEFKEGKNGFSIKLMDRLKALEWLADHMDLATEEQKARVESLRNKVKVDNETLELKKKQAEKDDW